MLAQGLKKLYSIMNRGLNSNILEIAAITLIINREFTEEHKVII